MPKMGDAMEEGTLVKWLKGEGEEVPERGGGGGAEPQQEEEEGGDGQAQAQTATETEEDTGEGEDSQQTNGQAGGGAGANGNFRASPIVRRLARENNLDLSRIDGSGPQGRIVERDVRAAMERGDAQADGQAAAQADGGQAEVEAS